MIENNRVRSRSETIECSLLIGFRRCIACRSHQSGQRLEVRIVNGCIKVSAQDNRRFLTGNLSNLRHDQFHTLLTGNFPLVVEVSVEIEKLLARTLVAQFDPCYRAVAGRIPSARHVVGSLADPEGAAVQQFEPVAEVEHRHRFAAFGPAVTILADTGIPGTFGVDVIQLVLHGFLHAHHIGSLLPEHLRRGVTTVRPTVVAVAPPTGTHIERNQFDRYCILTGLDRVRETERKQQKKHCLFHRNIYWFVA